MPAKKKPGREILVPAKPKKKPKELDPIEQRMAKAAAAEVTRNWLREPHNRTEVIMPPGKNYKPGTPDFVNKTKGRFQAAGMVYDKTYKDVSAFIEKRRPAKPKTVTSASTRSKKKK
jgi:hypothetical protein